MMRKRKLKTAILAAGAAISVTVAASMAGYAEQPGDVAWIDSNGNLVIDAAAGYRQIIVGGGKVLEEAGVDPADLFEPMAGNAAPAGDSPSIIRRDGSEVTADSVTVIRPPRRDPRLAYVTGECRNGVIVIYGRSYMYGLDKGETPIITGHCD